MNGNPPTLESPVPAEWAHFNKLPPSGNFLHECSIMRHGTSLAQERDEIVSDPIRGVDPRYGLSPAGRNLVHVVVEKAIADGIVGLDTEIWSSPFSRALETALIVSKISGAPLPRVDSRLRERNFGKLEGSIASLGYPRIWALDGTDPAHTHLDVESVVSVLSRVTEFFLEVLSRPKNPANPSPRRILAVLHGDTGQISEIGFRHADPRCHRLLASLGSAEIRNLSKIKALQL